MLFLSLIGAIWFAFVCPPKNFLYVKSQWYIFPPYKAIFYLPWHREFLFDAIRKHYKWKFNLEVTLVKFSSVTQSCPPFCDPMDCSMPGFPAHYQLLELTQTHVHWVSDASQPSHPLLSPSPPAFNISQHQGLFRWVSSLHQVARVLELQLQHQSFRWIFRTDFFRIDWFDLFAVQGTLKSLLQYHSSKASILWHWAFFIVQLSHPYMTTGKNHSFD